MRRLGQENDRGITVTNTLFDLDEFNAPATKPLRSERWVLYYQHNGKTYLGRRFDDPYRSTHYEWLEEGEPTRKLPTRYKSMSVARRFARELNNHRTASGMAAEVIVQVKLWSGK